MSLSGAVPIQDLLICWSDEKSDWGCGTYRGEQGCQYSEFSRPHETRPFGSGWRLCAGWLAMDVLLYLIGMEIRVGGMGRQTPKWFLNMDGHRRRWTTSPGLRGSGLEFFR